MLKRFQLAPLRASAGCLQWTISRCKPELPFNLIHMYDLGLWCGFSEAAQAAGCQVLSTSNFADD